MNNHTPTINRPKYLRFADEIRLRVRDGELKPGDRLPSLNQAREQWGMGLSTVQRAHDLLEKDGLIVREHGKGTFISHPQRRPTNGCIGFFRNAEPQSLRYPYWTHLVEGMQSAASRVGVEITLVNPEVETTRWEKIDAVVALSANLAFLNNRLPVTMPCVSLMERLPGVPSVVADEYSGVYAAVHHLLSLGHRKIGYLRGKYSQEGMLRLAGYERALREAGIEPRPEWIGDLFGGDERASVSFVEMGRISMGSWLREGFRDLDCTALLMQNDETALGAVEVLRDAGIKVPDELSIIGFDGTEVAEYCSPPLTTVVMPLHEMGQTAVDLLVAMLREDGAEQAPQTITLPTMLNVRESTVVPHARTA